MTDRLYIGNIAETIRDSREHTVRFPFCEVVYWEGGSAAHFGDNWDRLQIKRGHFPTVEFDLRDAPDRKRLVSRVVDILRLLHMAYERGALDKAQQVRDILNCARSASFGPDT